MLKREKDYLCRVSALGCSLCRMLERGDDTPAEIHHPREGQGGAQRASNWLAIPLCPDCHRGSHGVHGDRGLLRQAKVTEMDLLADTISRMVR